MLYDGEGCLSLHAIFVEHGAATSVATFAGQLDAACVRTALDFPRGPARREPAVTAYRRAARFRAAQGVGALYGTEATHLVVLEPAREEPPPLLPRTLAVYGVDGPADAATYLARHRLPLEAVALSHGARAEVVAFAAASGAARVATLGASQRPPLGGDHGGHGRILPFVRAIYRG
ncbi:MAG: hypothetical protein NVSMB21_12010 [Vulcanimicrobiaceae bacterium]